MTSKEQFDAFMKQAEFAFNSFHTRRNYEWKITLGLWVLIVLATRFLYGRPPHLPMFAWFCIPVAVAVIHGAWLKGIWQALQSDKAAADYFRACAADIIAGRDPGDVKLPPRVVAGWSIFFTNWAVRFQFAATIMLCVGCVLVLVRSG